MATYQERERERRRTGWPMGEANKISSDWKIEKGFIFHIPKQFFCPININ